MRPRVEQRNGLPRRLCLRTPALLLVVGGLSLAVGYEFPTASLGTPQPIGSAVAPGHERRTPAGVFDDNVSTFFVTDAEDGAAFAGLSYSRPMRLLRAQHRYTRRVAPAQQITGARLQWSDDGEEWHDGSPEQRSEAGDIGLTSLEERPHRFWRFLVTQSREKPLSAIGDLAFESAALVAARRVRTGLSVAALIAVVLATVVLAVQHRQEGRRLLTLPARVFRAANERRTAYLVGAAALFAYYNYFFLIKFSVIPFVIGDAGTYLNNSPVRSPGYPAFIDLFGWLSGNWSLFPAVQLNLLLCSIVLLGLAIARLSGSYALALLFLAGVTQFELLFASAANMLTEAPFTAFFTLHVALVLLLLARFSRLRALGAGVALMCAVAVKPVAMVLVAPAALSLLFLRPHRRLAALLLLAPTLVYHLGVSSLNQARYGVFDSSILGGFALLGHVAWMIEADPSSDYPDLSARLEERLRPVLDERPPAFESMEEYALYTSREYNRLLWGNAAREIQSFVDSPEGPGKVTGRPARVQASKVAMTLAKEAIARAPGRYAYHVVAHYYGMWNRLFSRGAMARQLAAGTARSIEQRRSQLEEMLDPAELARALAPANFHAAKLVPTLPAAPLDELLDRQLLAIVSRALLVVSLIGCALLAFAFRLPPAARGLCLASLYINAYMSGHALAQVRTTRYALVMQPVAVGLALLALFAVVSIAAAGIRRQP